MDNKKCTEFWDYISDRFHEVYGVYISVRGLNRLMELGEKYGDNEVVDAVEIAVRRYKNADEAWEKIGGILCNRMKIRGGLNYG